MTHFFNTTNVQGDLLLKYREDAKSQEDRIFAYLKSKPWEWYTPDALRLLLFDEMTPITSIRRAITCLQKKGKLEKSPSANAMGPYGKPCHTWRYKR